MQDGDIGIDTIFKVLMHLVLQCITMMGCIDLNNMSYIRTYNFESTSQIIELALQ